MFEVKETDLAGRIGRLRTKGGTLETPALLPVIHPYRQEVEAGLVKELGFEAVMTNAYLAYKHYGPELLEKGIHKAIGFDGVVMTDSGGYQVLEYGDIDITPEEVVRIEEGMGSDLAVLLDRPTGLTRDRAEAEWTVSETIGLAKRSLKVIRRRDIVWVAPVQGGVFEDLVKLSAREALDLGFEMLALGSPTEVMESYRFDMLVRMVMAAKSVSPFGPFHLFGAGHPLTIPLAVAMGCDTFDSASYILYAKDGRYMTDWGTVRLEELNYLPCSCPVCSKGLEELMEMDEEERVRNLAIHNLYVLKKEVEATKEALSEGRLWEYLMLKARAHPRLYQAVKLLSDYVDMLEDGTPSFKPRALFFFDELDYGRPEVVRHRRRLNWMRKREKLILALGTGERPFYGSKVHREILKALGDRAGEFQISFILPPFGVVPVEVSDVYPLSQNEAPEGYLEETAKLLIPSIREYVESGGFSKVLVLDTGSGGEFLSAISSALKAELVDLKGLAQA